MVCIGVYKWLGDVCTVDVPMCSVCACVCVQGECGEKKLKRKAAVRW